MGKRRPLGHDWGARQSFQAFIVFELPKLERGWPAFERWPLHRQLAANDVTFALWRHVLTAEQSSPRHDDVLVHAVEQLLRFIVSGHGGAGAVADTRLPEAVERAMQALLLHLETRPSRPLRLPELARVARVSEQHLTRLFKQSLGTSPMQCFQLLRLEQVGALLDRTELSLKQIAERLGYSSSFHLSRAFTEGYGMTPSAYRKAFREGSVTRPAGIVYRHHRLRHYVYEQGPGRIIGP